MKNAEFSTQSDESTLGQEPVDSSDTALSPAGNPPLQPTSADDFTEPRRSGSIRISLNHLLNWKGACRALGIATIGYALPQSSRCPLCGREALHLLYDDRYEGAWYHCSQCKSAGDLI